MKAFKLIIAYCTLTVALLSCKEDNDRQIACTEQFLVQYVNFRIVDKNTNQDLFLSASPLYDTKELKLYYKNKNLPVDIKTTAANEKYFSFANINLELGTGDLSLIIANGSPEIITFNNTLSSSPCPVREFKSITYNGNTQTDIRDKIITLKR
jgi:hypothetical protein